MQNESQHSLGVWLEQSLQCDTHNSIVKIGFLYAKATTPEMRHYNDFPYKHFNKYRHYCKIMLTRHDSTQEECVPATFNDIFYPPLKC